ncbi:MAG: hypothetical protein J7K22_01765 [Nanoarchaeota archaeon]|nr:hypothetical protein [Nanoarchaeota archaeon]
MQYKKEEQSKWFWLNKFLPNVSTVFKDKILISIKSRDELKLFVVKEGLYNVLKKVKKSPVYVGFPLLTLKNNEPHFSLILAEKYAKANRKRVVVNAFGEEKFLYKRNLMKKHIVSFSKDIKKGDLVVVVNKRNEALGFGKALFSSNEGLPEGRVVNHIIDRGFFIHH